jgi:hypothetical protein
VRSARYQSKESPAWIVWLADQPALPARPNEAGLATSEVSPYGGCMSKPVPSRFPILGGTAVLLHVLAEPALAQP